MRSDQRPGTSTPGDEGLDVGLPLHHQPVGPPTAPARRQAADLLTAGGRSDSLRCGQHPARLLGVHQIHIDGPGWAMESLTTFLVIVEGHP